MFKHQKGFLTILFLFCFFSVGARYFQQEVNYTIHVTLNDNKHELSADATIVYKNNSDSTFKEIYFHLYPAAYKGNNTILGKEIYLSGDDRMLRLEEKDFGDIDSLHFKVGGEDVKWHLLGDTIDICKVILNRPLNPGDSVTITTPFHVKIPSSDISRLGHSDQAYFISQWFPKPAVFDENGWNYFPYLDQGEYYSDFGTYDVYITLPDNYVLAATGKMIDAKKEYEWLAKNDSITRTMKKFPTDDTTPQSSKTFKTIHFREERVHDFAWFADKRYHVLKDTATSAGKTVTTWSFFNNTEAEYWIKGPQYMRDALRLYTEWAGPYPYDNLSAVDVEFATGNGMEYPTIFTIGYYGSLFDFEATVVHEVAHNWFYGMLASDERNHPWMDEGMTNFFETRYFYTKYKNDSVAQEEESRLAEYKLSGNTTTINHRKRQYYGYLVSIRRNSDQSPDLSSDKLSNANYRNDVYYKSSISFEYLKSYLGDSLFDSCMRNYYDQWAFRHPDPEDIEEVFEKVSGKNLDWMFHDLLGSSRKLDYKVVCAKSLSTDSVELTLKNNGEVAGPLVVEGLRKENPVAETWLEGFNGTKKIVVPCDGCDKYTIDIEERMPELSELNNTSRLNGLFRKTEKLKLSMGIQAENRKSTTINFAPVAGWNLYNSLMAGVVVHNISFHEKKFEYNIMPMYATGTEDITGAATLRYHIYPRDSRIYKIAVSSSISSYTFGDDYYEGQNDFVYEGNLKYIKLDSKIVLSIMQKNRQESYRNEIMLRSVFINRDLPYYYNYEARDMTFKYWQAEYKRENINPLKQSLQKINLTFGEGLIYGSGEVQRFFSYGKFGKGFTTRVYAGFVSLPSNSDGIDYRISLNGRDGMGDYLFDEIFFARSDVNSLLSKQFVSDYAGFKSPTAFFRLGEEWMTGINLNTTLPGFIPFRLFANVGTFDKADSDGEFGKISWELGIDLPIYKDIFVIYLPFAYSEDIKDAIEKQHFNTGECIRFEIHLNALNPLSFIKNIYPE